MDFQGLTLVLIAISIVLVLIAVFWLGYLTSKLTQTHQVSQLSLLASLWATTSAESLKKSTVIQRIIEKYHPQADPEEGRSRIAREMDELLEEFSLGNSPDTTEGGKLAPQTPKPEDLV